MRCAKVHKRRSFVLATLPLVGQPLTGSAGRVSERRSTLRFRAPAAESTVARAAGWKDGQVGSSSTSSLNGESLNGAGQDKWLLHEGPSRRRHVRPGQLGVGVRRRNAKRRRQAACFRHAMSEAGKAAKEGRDADPYLQAAEIYETCLGERQTVPATGDGHPY